MKVFFDSKSDHKSYYIEVEFNDREGSFQRFIGSVDYDEGYEAMDEKEDNGRKGYLVRIDYSDLWDYCMWEAMGHRFVSEMMTGGQFVNAPEMEEVYDSIFEDVPVDGEKFFQSLKKAKEYSRNRVKKIQKIAVEAMSQYNNREDVIIETCLSDLEDGSFGENND